MPKATRSYRKSSAYATLTRLKRGGWQHLDKRTRAAKLAREYSDALVDSLGTDLSCQEMTLVGLAVGEVVIISVIDRFLSIQPSLIEQDKEGASRLLALIQDRAPHVRSLVQILDRLGLKRTETPSMTFQGYIESRYGADAPSETET